MKFNLKLLFATFSLFSSIAYAQTTLKGTVKDKNGEPLMGANIMLTPSKGTITDFEGKYSIKNIENGNYTVRVSFLGYKSKNKLIEINSQKAITLNFTLMDSNQELGEVIITSNRTRETLDEVPSSVSVLNARQIENLAQTSNSVADVLTEVPGLALSSNRTSSTGQTLRGRNMLILIDGIPVHTSS